MYCYAYLNVNKKDIYIYIIYLVLFLFSPSILKKSTYYSLDIHICFSTVYPDVLLTISIIHIYMLIEGQPGLWETLPFKSQKTIIR